MLLFPQYSKIHDISKALVIIPPRNNPFLKFVFEYFEDIVESGAAAPKEQMLHCP